MYKRKESKQRHQVGDLLLSSLETFVVWMTTVIVEILRNRKMQVLFGGRTKGLADERGL